MIRYLVVPGYRGSEPGHWQRHFLDTVPGARLVEQEDWENPSLPDWLHTLEAHLAASPGAVIVGHSLGATLVSWLAERPASAHVAGALLVAPADSGRMARTDERFRSFAAVPRRTLPFASVVVASRDDPYMSFPAARSFADAWGSGLLDLGNAGHINPASGFGPWDEARTLAASLAGDADERGHAGPAAGPHLSAVAHRPRLDLAAPLRA